MTSWAGRTGLLVALALAATGCPEIDNTGRSVGTPGDDGGVNANGRRDGLGGNGDGADPNGGDGTGLNGDGTGSMTGDGGVTIGGDGSVGPFNDGSNPFGDRGTDPFADVRPLGDATGCVEDGFDPFGDGGLTGPDGSGPGLDGGGTGGDGGTTVGEQCGNGFDDDGDGMVDEACVCLPGTRQYCYPGRPSEAGVSGCNWGTQNCVGGEEFGTWTNCVGAGAPSPEVCDGTDNNCDRRVDEGCSCTAGATRDCFPGPTGVSTSAPCHVGHQSCVSSAGGATTWGACTDYILPAIERCDHIDNDCDGMVDEGCECQIGNARECYTGAAGTAGVGACVGGTQRCVERPDGTSGWGTCDGQVVPNRIEACDGVDNDCNGRIDEGCPCTTGMTRSCYAGPAGTSGRGQCRAGTITCTASGAWTACVGQVLPAAERCDGIDNDCTGEPDEWCLCPPGQTVTYNRRDLASVGMRSMLIPADGLPIQPQTCGPMRCAESQVAVEVSRGVFRCVNPPPNCPAGRYPHYNTSGVWECRRPCEVVVQYGGIYDYEVVCAPRPEVTCGPGQTPHFAYETETWVCRATCDNGQYDLYNLGTRPVCIPC